MRCRATVLSRTLYRALAATYGDHADLNFKLHHWRPPNWGQRREISSPGESSGKYRPLQRYEDMVKEGLLQHDDKQHSVAQMLDGLLGQMNEYQKEMESYEVVFSKWSKERQEHKKGILKEQANAEAQRRLHQIAKESRSGVFGWWSRKKRHVTAEPGAGRMVARIKREKQLDSLVGPRPALPPSPKGLYLYGNVGCGKTFLMDMFFNASDGVVKHRRRMHFHAAMLEVHDWMHKLWKQARQNAREQENVVSNTQSLYGNTPLTLEMAANKWLEEEQHWDEGHESEASVLNAVADRLFGLVEEDAGGARLLCFDELQVVDVFTAVALAVILSRLLSRGTVIVATSNRAPTDLNENGLQKDVFTAFIAKLEQHCQSILVGVDKDYRRVIASLHNRKDRQIHYFWPLGSQSQHKLEQMWSELVVSPAEQQGVSAALSIPVMFGRVLEVPESSSGVARFSFEELCSRPLGAADYVSIAQNFHTVFISDIPVMSMRNSDQARRFITLVDELYNHHCRLICTAAAPVDELFLGTEEGALIDLESLQFETEAEGSRLRRDVLVSGSVAPLGGTMEDKAGIETIMSGREELFAFRRAVSRMIEMESPIYLQVLASHPKFTSPEPTR